MRSRSLAFLFLFGLLGSAHAQYVANDVRIDVSSPSMTYKDSWSGDTKETGTSGVDIQATYKDMFGADVVWTAAKAQARNAPGEIGVGIAINRSNPPADSASPLYYVDAYANAILQDRVILSSPTLAPGTAVTLTLTQLLVGNMATTVTNPNQVAWVNLFGTSSFSGQDSDYDEINGGTGVGHPFMGLQFKALTIHGKVGDEISLETRLHLQAHMYGYDGVTEGSFLNTLHSHIDASEDVNLVGLSGYDYSKPLPVPEPASFTALGVGALALLRRRRLG